jgi:hypothetical protein
MRIAAGNNANAFPSDPLWEYASELAFLVSVPLLVVAAIGAVWACRRWTHGDLLHLLWLAVFLGVMTFRVPHKEARYLLPILPSLVFLQLRGFEALHLAIARTTRRWAMGASAALSVALSVPAAWAGVSEGLRFADPVYRGPFLPDIAHWIREKLQPDGRVVMTGCWVFNMYAKDPVVMPTDEYNHLHHLNHTSFEYYLDHRVEEAAVPATNSPGIADAFPRGGAIIRLPPFFFDANAKAQIPEPPLGLSVDRIQRLTLRALPAPSPDETTYAAADGKPLAVLTRPDGGTWQVRLDESVHDWWPYARGADGAVRAVRDAGPHAPASLELVHADSREFKFR